MELKNELRAYIVENFLYGDSARLKDETSFLEEGIIDSTGMLELINHLEATYKIKIDDSELVPSNLDSLNALVDYVMRKQGGQTDEAA